MYWKDTSIYLPSDYKEKVDIHLDRIEIYRIKLKPHMMWHTEMKLCDNYRPWGLKLTLRLVVPIIFYFWPMVNVKIQYKIWIKIEMLLKNNMD